MCGIAGFTNPAADAHRILLEMNGALGHRGPDGSGIFVDHGIAFGHTRLAIVDLAGGAQPRVDRASGDALVFNGEIYGYRSLAAELKSLGVPLRDRSDTEVLFQLIRREGIRRAVERIDGMFAFAFRDGATNTLYLVRDRFGEKPLYYGMVGSDIIFASEVPAVQCHPAFRDVSPDPDAAYSFLLFEYLPGTASGWQGIAKLEPGTILTVKDGKVAIDHYWRPRLEPVARAARREEAIDQLDELLSASVSDRVIADVPVGVFLSGGLDSSLVTAFARKAAPDLTAFSVRIGQGSFDETPYATEVARHLGVRHHVVGLDDADVIAAFDAIADKLGEPLADSSLLPTYLVCRAARSLMTVALGGDGADELFLGYPNFAVQRFAWAMRFIPASAAGLVERAIRALPVDDDYMNWRFLATQLAQGFGAATTHQSFLWMAPFAPSRMADLWHSSALPEGAMVGRAFAPIDRRATEVGALNGVERLAYQFLTTYLPEDILTKTDRASMFNSLEVRAPFLSRAVAEYTGSLPTGLKLRGGVKKYILKQLACRYLPRPIVYRKKHGFAVPIGRVMRTLLRTRCQDVLMSTSNPVAGWFRRPEIETLLTEHASGRIDHGKKLWALYILFCVAARRRMPRLALPVPADIPTLAASG
jgi:asparagine synthase (glutamine-hydrolysing)